MYSHDSGPPESPPHASTPPCSNPLENKIKGIYMENLHQFLACGLQK